MKKIVLNSVLLIAFTGFSVVNAAEDVNRKTTVIVQKSLADCSKPSSLVELDINNVRTTLRNGGDLWWNGDAAKYEIPKIVPRGSAPSINSLFSGALWFGGRSSGGELLVAAATYRQGGTGFWAGPLTNTGTITPDVCAKYDKHYKLNLSDIEAFKSGNGKSGYAISDAILNWPGNGDVSLGQAQQLAPYVDAVNDGIYDPTNIQKFKDINGQDSLVFDYPTFDPSNTNAKPDQFIWWVYNDAGGAPTTKEFVSESIGVEIHTTAFAYQANDALNNTTFYRNVIFNRSQTTTLNRTYFGIFVDADLGYAFDDYVGCDVSRSLGFCYNGDDDDDASRGGYGLNPPSVGVDFFKGPIGDNGKVLPLAKFMYYNNDATPTGNPNTKEHVYNYLQGIFKDNTRCTYGGSGYNTGSTDTANFMFPDNTDPLHANTKWNERLAGNVPADRRFVQSAGPFTLLPGAKNEITYGVVWAKTDRGGATGSLNQLKAADDLAQSLFDNKFVKADGPPAPESITITEFNRKLVMVVDQFTKTERYTETATLVGETSPRLYKFQGYKIFQLANAKVSATEFNNPNKAVMLYQCDLKDGVAQIVNQYNDPNLGSLKIPQEMVFGENLGLKHIFEFTQDPFNNNETLVNDRKYYYAVVRYAFSADAEFVPYLEGQKDVEIITGIPHLVLAEKGGSKVNSDFQSGFSLTRLSGAGGGSNLLDITKESENTLFDGSGRTVIEFPKYEAGKGPIDVRVIDPRKVPNADFELRFTKSGAAYTGWTLKNKTTNEVIVSDSGLVDYQQVINKYGFYVQIDQNFTLPGGTGNDKDKFNGFLEASMDFANPDVRWLDGVRNLYTSDGSTNPFLWLGNYKARGSSQPVPNRDKLDPFDNYGSLLNGIIAPYRLTSTDNNFGSFYISDGNVNKNKLDSIQSINLVITPDKSKWSRCVVIEMSDISADNEGGASKYSLRKGTSLDIDGNPETGTGRSWFPGYAVNVATGERLNISFSEASNLLDNNGRDMKWNPTNVTTKNPNGSEGVDFPLGGRHYIFVHNTRYDSCNNIMKIFNSNTATKLAGVYSKIIWAMNPLADVKNHLNNEVRIRLRVKSKYKDFNTTDNTNSGVPYYSFSTKDQATVTNDKQSLEKALDAIRVVPNPYYSFSQYEVSQVDTRVKITNLPTNTSISIYTADGSLVRRLNKTETAETSLEWDMKNANGVPIASGAYLFYIRCYDNTGKKYERVQKWFCVNRPLDLSTY